MFISADGLKFEAPKAKLTRRRSQLPCYPDLSKQFACSSLDHNTRIFSLFYLSKYNR